MDTTRDLQFSSGWEVESAVSHPVVETRMTLPERSGMRGRLDSVRSRSLSRVHDIQRVVTERGTAMKGSLVSVQGSLRDGAKSQVSRMQRSMRTAPTVWAGAAAGTGFALGLLGRIASSRRSRRMMPAVIIVETGCA